VMRAGDADAKPDELDWPAIVEYWDLPFPKAKRQKRGKK
jgi:hypothetical protein